MSDLHDAMSEIAADAAGSAARRRAAGPDALAALVAEARRRRRTATLRTAGIGVAAVTVLGLAGVASAQLLQRDPLPPVVSLASPTPSVTPSPTPSATPSPTTAFVPDLSACGTAVAVDVLVSEGTGELWAGNYAGGEHSDVDGPISLPVSLVVGADWGGQTVRVTPLDGFLVDAWDAADGTPHVVGVPSVPWPGPTEVAMHAGGEDGGAGSEGRLDLTIPFVSCDGGRVTDGPYEAWVKVQVDRGGDVRVAWAQVPAVVGDATWPGTDPGTTLGPLDLTADPGIPACGSVYDLAEVAYVEGDPLPPWYLGLMAFHPTPSGQPGEWVAGAEYGPTGTGLVTSLSDPVAVLVRQSDQVVVSRTPLGAVGQQYLARFFSAPLTRQGFYPQIDVAHHQWSWAPTTCVDLDAAHPAGSSFDPGDWDDDHGLTLHVGQRVDRGDGTVRWYWTSRNPNDPVYAP